MLSKTIQKQNSKDILVYRLNETERFIKKTQHLVTIIVILCFLFSPLNAEELPIPTFNNTVIISLEHSVLDSAEVDYIKNNFDFGMYTLLSFSHTHVDPILAWQSDWSDAANGIQGFKDSIDSYIAAAKNKNVKIHIVLCSGLARGLKIYHDAKLEDIRNAQWYNDNLLAVNDPTANLSDFDTYVFGTFSRYARKLRANLEAKAKAALAFLKQRMDENPDTIIALSGWGEAELNFGRSDHSKNLQDFFCDYSPFSVLEFRDWIQHTGMYDDTSGLYKGQGYSGGGTKYHGDTGRAQFNSDFLTNFTTWDLKYFNWNLTDPYDTDPTDLNNPDPNKIPYTAYSHGNMMSLVGDDAIPGGFDPPRVMEYPTQYPGESHFWTLFNLFRETMVHNLVKDMAKWASEAGIPAEKWYSHQIPGDYLFGTNSQTVNKNPRYYSSASPLWTANNLPYGSMGATIYDIKFHDSDYGDYWVRTSQYCVPEISQMSSNWAVMEYDAEVYPDGLDILPSSPEFILEQYLRTYNYYCHLFNFFMWKCLDIYNIKGTNKEAALRLFINSIKDKGRKQNLVNRLAPPDFAYTPPKITNVSGQYVAGTGSLGIAAASGIQIDIGLNIWNGQNWKWEDWGDFKHFEIHRSPEPNFTPNPDTFLATTTNYSYTDSTVAANTAYFYQIRTVNSKSVGGPYSDEQMFLPSTIDVPILHVSNKSIIIAINQASTSSIKKSVSISNLGAATTTINWQASSSQSWITTTPTSGTGEGSIEIDVDTAAFTTGIYQGEVTITDPNAFNSPQIIQVTVGINGPDIHLPSSTVAFGKGIISETYDSELLIENKGNSTLTLSIAEAAGSSNFKITNSVFSIVSSPTSIPAQSSDKVVIRFSPSAQTTYSTSYKISTNDIDETEVTYNVTGEGVIGAVLALSKSKLSFGAQLNGTQRETETIIISNSGDFPLQWQATPSHPWIELGSTSGSDNALLNITIDPTDMPEGSHIGEVTITDPSAHNSPLKIDIVLKVFSDNTDGPPFGIFDTPINGATVSGSVAVTGWALDNIGIQKVEIKRDPHVDDSPAAIGGDGLVYIGIATFVKGSRPDVASLYPDYPHSDKAGWGYMLLTFGLPQMGNGTFKLYAFAEDINGKRTLLGTKNITADNANRIKPFGTIDTPGPGEVISGSAYVNFGWALTPHPKWIPYNGSTLYWSIDSVIKGNVDYGDNRTDIASSFPGYLNANTAGGHKYIDTTQYTNGVHSIGWLAYDSDGVGDGMGSRFIEIQNLGGTSSEAAALSRLGLRVDTTGQLEISTTEGRNIKIEEMGLIKLKFKNNAGLKFVGWGEDMSNDLPAGSTLDEEKGIFTWMPAPGFLNQHVLHFAATNGVSVSKPLKIVIHIIPRKYALSKDTKKEIKR
ncbi:MAG: choice-of-anchor D domain-containing protein [Candidatus Aminicenantes bacterium]|nr:choice-of-anchor D domain-containing protein [Candidatus Aminicenantes bacterium]